MSISENEIDSNSYEENEENEEKYENEENEEDESLNKNKKKFKKNNKNKLNSSSDSEAEIFQKNLSENDEDNNLQYKNYIPPDDEINIFEQNISNIKENITNLNEKLVNLLNNLNDNNIQFKYGLSFFDAKNNLFLMYLIELLLYINYKLNPNESIKNSDLLKQLIINKTLIEKLKVIDMKIKNQVDRLINVSEDSKNNNIESNYKPRLLDEEEEESLDEEKEEKKNKEKEKIKYQVNKKLVEFFETKNEKKNRKRQIENDKQRIRNSEYLNVLREEMSDKPRVIESYNKNTNKFMKEIENYEDEHFTNIRIPKKIKKIIKKKESKIDDLNYFDKEIKQMSNILLNDNSKEEENREKKIKFLQRKREINELNKKFNKQKNIKKKK